MKLCLHLSYIAQNSFHFDEIFHRKVKIPILVCVALRRHLVAILGIFAVLKLIFPYSSDYVAIGIGSDYYMRNMDIVACSRDRKIPIHY